MKTMCIRSAWSVPVVLALLLSGCGSMSVWPFGDDKPKARSGPENATEYQCEGNKHFYVRYLENGNLAWLIYPDREVALNKSASGSGARYTNGTAVLEVNGSEASLKDGASTVFNGCKAVVAKPS